jgi:hypothetical protein
LDVAYRGRSLFNGSYPTATKRPTLFTVTAVIKAAGGFVIAAGVLKKGLGGGVGPEPPIINPEVVVIPPIMVIPGTVVIGVLLAIQLFIAYSTYYSLRFSLF